MNTQNNIFTHHERYFCQWTSGAREYFNTLEQAIEKANQMYVRTPTMTDDNYNYWLKQQSIVGKELVIHQQLSIISFGMGCGNGEHITTIANPNK